MVTVASTVDALATGSASALEEEVEGEHPETVAEVLSAVQLARLASVIAVGKLVIMPRTAIFSRTPATTVEEQAILQKNVPRLNGRESSAVTSAASQATWLVIVTGGKRRNATLVANLGTSKKTAPKSSATDVVRMGTWWRIAARLAKSTATAVASLDI